MSMYKLVFGVLILVAFGAGGADAVDQAICSPGEKVVLYPNGFLKSCVMKDDFRLEEIKCRSQNPISFYDNGRLETCVLAQAITISGQKCKELAPISFYLDGKFKSCVKED